jgi:Tol biopolymer transport system component
MTDPRRASVKVLAVLTLAALAAALPLKHAAQSAASKQQTPNGKIVFQSTQGGDGFTNDIYTMDAEGRHQTRLTDDPGDDTSAFWSPQGDRIAFLSGRRGNGYEIFVMNADGSDQRPLRDANAVFVSPPVWSPDGTRVAYTDGSDVYVAAVDGTDAPVNVSANKALGSTDTDPSWSPDGTRVVVSNSIPCGGCTDLYVINVSDNSRTQLSTGPGFDTTPRWSPTGDLVAYEGFRFPDGRGVYVTAADGTGPETLVSGTAGSFGTFEWSPDGTRIAFRALAGDSAVHVVNADGSGLTPLSDAHSSSGNIFWSPDGSKVGFHDANADGCVDILVVAADGSGRRAANYTKTKRADEFALSWQKLTTP